MALTDDIARLTQIVVSLHTGHLGLAYQLRSGARLDAGKVGKLCGVSADTVYAWERGDLQPTTGEALTWLTVLLAAQPRGQAAEPGPAQAGPGTWGVGANVTAAKREADEREAIHAELAAARRGR